MQLNTFHRYAFTNMFQSPSPDRHGLTWFLITIVSVEEENLPHESSALIDSAWEVPVKLLMEADVVIVSILKHRYIIRIMQVSQRKTIMP